MKKTGDFKSAHIDLQSIFWALSHASRRKILVNLGKNPKGQNGKEIASQLSCAWPTTTRHLIVLKRAGLVSMKKDGREKIYFLRRARLSEALQWLGKL